MLRAAVRAGADIVDADVRVTKDGVLVASHDDGLASTTNGSGSLRAHTLAELRQLDAAWTWAGPSRTFPLRGTGVKIATVEEILRAFPNRRVSLELKASGDEQGLCTLLRRLGRTGDVYVSTASDAYMDRFKPLCPEVTTTVTDAIVGQMRTARERGAAWCSPAPIGQPPFYRDGRPRLTAESVRWSHDHGMAVYTWTLDRAADLDAARRLGVDGVYTGRADLARKLFDQR
jgi:glycerophosphoryl diester phosphodiesterase